VENAWEEGRYKDLTQVLTLLFRSFTQSSKSEDWSSIDVLDEESFGMGEGRLGSHVESDIYRHGPLGERWVR